MADSQAMREAREQAARYASSHRRGGDLSRLVTALANQYTLSAAVAHEIVEDAFRRKQIEDADKRGDARAEAQSRRQGRGGAKSRMAGQLARAEMYATPRGQRKTPGWRDRHTRTPEQEAAFREYNQQVRADIRAFKRGELAIGATKKGATKKRKGSAKELWAVQVGVPGETGVYRTSFGVMTVPAVRHALKAASEHNRSLILAGKVPGAWPFAYKVRALFTYKGITADDVIKHWKYGIRTEVPEISVTSTLRDAYKKLNFVQAKWGKVMEGGVQVGTFSMRDYMRAFLNSSDPGSIEQRVMAHARKTNKGKAGTSDPGVYAKLRTVLEGDELNLYTPGTGKPPPLRTGRPFRGPQPMTLEQYTSDRIANFVEWHEDDLDTLIGRIQYATGLNFILLNVSTGELRVVSLGVAVMDVMSSEDLLVYMIIQPPAPSRHMTAVCDDPWRPSTSLIAKEVKNWATYSALDAPTKGAAFLLKPVTKTRVTGILGVDVGERGIIEAARLLAKRRSKAQMDEDDDEDWNDPDEEVASIIDLIASVRQRATRSLRVAHLWVNARRDLEEAFDTYADESWEEWDGDYDDIDSVERAALDPEDRESVDKLLDGLHSGTLGKITREAMRTAHRLAPYTSGEACAGILAIDPPSSRKVVDSLAYLAALREWSDELDVAARRLIAGKIVGADMDYEDEWEDEDDELRENALKTLLKVETGRRLRDNPGIMDLHGAYRAAVKAARRNGWFANGRITAKGAKRLNDGEAPARKFAEAVQSARTEAWLHKAAASATPNPRPNPTGVPLSGVNVIAEQTSATKRVTIGEDVRTHEYRPVVRVPNEPKYGLMAGKTVRPRIQLPAKRLRALGALEIAPDGEMRLTAKGKALLLEYREEAVRRVLEAVAGQPQIQYVGGEIIPTKRYEIANVRTKDRSKAWEANPRGVAYRQGVAPPSDRDLDHTGFTRGLEELRDKMSEVKRGVQTYAGVTRIAASNLYLQLETLLFRPVDDGGPPAVREEAVAAKARRDEIWRLVETNPSRFSAILGTRDRSTARAASQMRSLLEDTRPDSVWSEPTAPSIPAQLEEDRAFDPWLVGHLNLLTASVARKPWFQGEGRRALAMWGNIKPYSGAALTQAMTTHPDKASAWRLALQAVEQYAKGQRVLQKADAEEARRLRSVAVPKKVKKTQDEAAGASVKKRRRRKKSEGGADT